MIDKESGSGSRPKLVSKVQEGVKLSHKPTNMSLGSSNRQLAGVKRSTTIGGGAKIDVAQVKEIVLNQLKELTATFVKKCEIEKDLETAKGQAEQAAVTCQVLAYKLDLSTQMQHVNAVDQECQNLENEVNRLILSFTPEQMNGPIRPKDFLRLFDTQNKQISVIRKQMTALERARLSENFNRIPKDIAYLTKSEAELKKEMVLCIEDGESYLATMKKELSRLRREHYENLTALEAITSEQKVMNSRIADVNSKQDMNDSGMATLFKINQITSAMELQDEQDKQKMFLMGASSTSHAHRLMKQG